jgi:hypothetical protein
MSQRSNNCAIAVIGIDIGKNSFHVVGQDQRGQKRRSRPARQMSVYPLTAAE